MTDVRQRKQSKLTGISEESQPSPDHRPRKSNENTTLFRKLLEYDAIPAWHQDNRYIKSGYRAETNLARLCLASWLYIHNETANIFTHFIPAVVSLACELFLINSFRSYYPAATMGDQLAFAFFLSSAAVCFGMSATYHTLMNHSASVSNLWLRLDYVGIIVLTLGELLSGVYFVFYCEPMLQRLYWTMITMFGLTTIVILVIPRFEGARFRPFRVSTFVLTGLSGFVPLFHGLKVFGYSQTMRQSGMPYYLLEGLLLVIGAMFYASRFPESIKPGTFDIWGCSHTIFHLFVVAATSVHGYGLWQAFDYNYYHRRS